MKDVISSKLSLYEDRFKEDVIKYTLELAIENLPRTELNIDILKSFFCGCIEYHYRSVEDVQIRGFDISQDMKEALKKIDFYAWEIVDKTKEYNQLKYGDERIPNMIRSYELEYIANISKTCMKLLDDMKDGIPARSS